MKHLEFQAREERVLIFFPVAKAGSDSGLIAICVGRVGIPIP